MRSVFLIATLLCLAACDRAAPPAAPSTDAATPVTRNVPAVVAPMPGTSAPPTPAPTAANLAMQRAAEGPRVVLRPCSTLSGDAYEKCKSENAAAIARANATQPEAR